MNQIVISLFLFFTTAFAGSIYEYPENSVMATMTKSELMSIAYCIDSPKDRELCRWLTDCIGLITESVGIPFSNCLEAYTGNRTFNCDGPLPVWPHPEAPSQVFECTNEVFGRQETVYEKQSVFKFETCAREMFATGCARRHNYYGHY